ncbi:hypothetical protein AYI68_g7558 [Smittium mucronatum]|uniref:Uncharacterized protein n=1 Tax=Smittium mucronatum TaxID=133383 RepID=A0A1R0GNC7_9FUNG|nr:hypothetical protein AYI68_g7558 [Smittium mucronatum]
MTELQVYPESLETFPELQIRKKPGAKPDNNEALEFSEIIIDQEILGNLMATKSSEKRPRGSAYRKPFEQLQAPLLQRRRKTSFSQLNQDWISN